MLPRVMFSHTAKWANNFNKDSVIFNLYSDYALFYIWLVNFNYLIFQFPVVPTWKNLFNDEIGTT